MDALLANLKNVNDPLIPSWAKLLINAMEIVITELKSIKELSQRVDILEEYKTNNEAAIQDLGNDNKRMNDEINNLKSSINILESSIDDQEQRSRNYCLLLHGIIEDEKEVTDDIVLDIINNKLGLNNVSLHNIQRSHRLGPRNNSRVTRNNKGKPRPIIFRFTDFRSRKMVFSNKKKLKGEGISISENLTKKRYELYQLAVTKYGFGKVWTIEGRVATKIGERVVFIKSVEEFE